MKLINTCDVLLIIRFSEKVKFGFIFTARGAHASLRNHAREVGQLSRPRDLSSVDYRENLAMFQAHVIC